MCHCACCLFDLLHLAVPLRLVNPYSTLLHPSEGRLELLYNDAWGTVCDDGFTDDDARVACASLGFR